MNLSQIGRPRGAHRRRKRLGRGPGSGHGNTATRGQKGAAARSGFSRRPGFEGGQNPLIRRIPKRGFTNRFHVRYAAVNVGRLDGFAAGTAVTPELLRSEGIVQRDWPVKILGDGALTKALAVTAHRFSKQAQDKITKAGGTISRL